MSRKIFVSYKHKDTDVSPIGNVFEQTTARDYVEKLIGQLDANDYIYKGEGNEDLSEFKDETIETKLKDKIFDSSITVVLISKNMKDSSLPENDQWIPWEISYSLKEISRNDRTSKTNAMLAVVLPDKNGDYNYFVELLGCPHCNGIKWKQEELFSIIGGNMFNKKEKNTISCDEGGCGILHVGDDHSYIRPVKWEDFIDNINLYFEFAENIKENIDDYEIKKEIA